MATNNNISDLGSIYLVKTGYNGIFRILRGVMKGFLNLLNIFKE